MTTRERLRLAEQAIVRFQEHGLETAIFTSLAEAVRWLGPADAPRDGDLLPGYG